MSNSKKILVVSGHGADWCTRSGGTLIKYLQQGAQVQVLALTYGERGESPEYWKQNPTSTVDQCKECRRKEAQAAADMLGIQIQFLDYGDYPLIFDQERIQSLVDIMLDFRPDIILTHSPGDPLNVDHEETFKATIRAASCAGMLGAHPNTPNHFVPDIFLFESSLPHSEFNNFKMDTYVDITDVMEQKMAAVACFASQPLLPGYYTDCAARRAEQATNWMRGRKTVNQAEGFQRFTPFVGPMLPTIELW